MTGAAPLGTDIHDLPAASWGLVAPELVGRIVEVTVVCAHPFGLGVEIVGHGAYGHVNAPNVSDLHHDLAAAVAMIGTTWSARVLRVEPGRQTTLSLRPSDL